ncbi:hypothetical protein [Amycolatopsis panacis]|uniref:hypothetical protein n=1 Tax=Amycolatopsis panacis TaxID=2340917 RepID=UPI001F371C3A|nr:hypothetical protein [Amycolatopsis panacis]
MLIIVDVLSFSTTTDLVVARATGSGRSGGATNAERLPRARPVPCSRVKHSGRSGRLL